ncbi:MAG: S1 RNA-binding domain-containing protein [Ilumatobacteraceae bacterium]|nr:S1 RNA-binding domain-containing protein [Ilumatobacteraceae bacterium]
MSALGDIAHVVVDGSNIATEGRSLPSLSQLNDAVMAFIEDHPDAAVTVVVDATFGHRIDKSEVEAFEEGVSNNELVAPPAGAVGRGDAFVLQIADKANAVVLSNDSFQEFHGTYDWLFDEGRLVGGKPVPHVGWVFVARVPVRGPVSRKATAKKRAQKRASRRSSKRASEPMPVPTAPPPGATNDAEPPDASPADAATTTPAVNSDTKRSRTPRKDEMVNELLPFLEFVEHHPVGTSVNATVASYSSHGAYITIGDDVRGYVPLRLMGDPAPASARKVLKIDESITAVVVDFAPGRRSIDCALPDMAAKALADAAQSADEDAQAADAADIASGGDDGTSLDEPARTDEAPAELVPEAVGGDRGLPGVASIESVDEPQAQTKKRGRKKRATKKSTTKKTAAKKTAAKKTAKKAPAKKAAAKKTATKKAAAKKTAAKKSATKKKSAAKKSATKKKAAKKSTRTKTNNEPASRKEMAATKPTGEA